MERLGDYLRKNIPELQEIVENKLEVKLGRIDVLPLSRFIANETKEELNLGLGKLGIKVAQGLLYFLELCGAAKPGNSSIYYSRSPLLWLLWGDVPERDMFQTGIHELVHIATARIAGKPLYQLKLPRYIWEGFAQYVTIDIMRDMQLRYDHSRSSYIKFKNELLRIDINDYGGIKKLILSFS